ncbi:MAG: histidine kinase [Chitinophagaceae bacterium]|jgi:hypothetical protein|nr:histidine kinase [Chitinophagaceae bacterium]
MYREYLKNNDAIFLIVIACAQFFWLYAGNNISPEVALADALISYGLLYGCILFIKYTRSFLRGYRDIFSFPLFYYLPVSHSLLPYSRYINIGLQSIILDLLWVRICRYLLAHVFFPSEQIYLQLWEQTFFLRGLTGWITLTCFAIIYFLSRELKRAESEIHEEQQTAQLRKDAELFKLRQQLQPHFLFNSLNSINALIGREPQKARQMVLQLSDYLRNTLKKEDDNFVFFQEEMNDLRLYLAIEQVRFGHRLNVEEKIEPGFETVKIPPFLLQPLVENAIKYGLYGTTGAVIVTISAQKINRELIFSIVNPFDATGVTPHGTGFGLDSVRRRLYLLYARNDLLKIEQSAAETGLQTFTVKLVIPLIN